LSPEPTPSEREAALADRVAGLEGARASTARVPAAARHRVRFGLEIAAGLAAVLLALFLLRGKAEPPAPMQVWLSDTSSTLALVFGESGGWSLEWDVPRSSVSVLQLTFHADEDGVQGARLLGPLEVGSAGWTPDEDQARVLAGGWFAELVLDPEGEGRLIGRVHLAASRP